MNQSIISPSLTCTISSCQETPFRRSYKDFLMVCTPGNTTWENKSNLLLWCNKWIVTSWYRAITWPIVGLTLYGLNFSEVTKTYLNLMVVEILSQVRQGYIHKDFRQQVRNLFASPVLKDRINNTWVFTAYTAVPTYSTYIVAADVLRRKKPGHQQPWYWPS